MGGFLGIVLLLLAWVAVLAPDRTVAELAPRWAPPPSMFRPIDGLSVHLRDEGPSGDPVPVLLLHGTSASLHTWDGWTAELSRTRRVIRADLPGFGLTGPDPDDRYDIPRYVRFVLALADSLHVAQFDLAGNSLGGEIAWETAARAPDRVRRLVLVDPAGFPLAATSVPLGFRLARLEGLSWLFSRILPRSVVESSVRDVYGDPSRITPALVDRYYELTLREGNRRSLPKRFAQSQPGADTMRLTDVRAPTLLLWGGQDRLIPPLLADRFRRLLPRSELVRYPALGHVPHEEDPASTVRDAARFLSAPR